MLAASTDADELAKKAFVSLEGVTDEWLQALPVEKVAGGQVPKSWRLRQYALSTEPFCGLCLIPSAAP